MDQTQEKVDSRVCPNCGATINGNPRFCKECGAAVEQLIEQQQTEQPIQPQYVYTESWMGSAPTQGTQPQGYQQAYPNTTGYQGGMSYGQPAGNPNVYSQTPYTQPTGQNMPNAYGNPYDNAYNMGNYYPGADQQKLVSGFAITGLILGILSILSCFLSLFNLFVAVPGILFSAVAIGKNPASRGMAIAGLCCSIAGAFFGVMLTVVVLM